MPWQQHVADVILEIDSDTGLLAYPEFGLTVPRQSGKSTFLLAKAVHRASAAKFFGPRQHIVYTAQTRKDARKKFEEDYGGVLEGSAYFRHKADPRWGNGNEHIRFPNHSRFAIEANTEKAGHGPTLDEAYIDEAFAQVDARLEQAFRPAMITRRNKQLGWISTAGWSDGSPYLQAKVKRGREQAEMGVREGLAYFEWSAPQDADPQDRAVWRSCMPALGHTISEDSIAVEFASMDLNDFRRAYLNQWVIRGAPSDWVVIPEMAWSDLLDPRSAPLDPVAFAADATPNQDHGSIGVAGLREDGTLHVEVIDHRPGMAWMPARLLELYAKWRPCAVVVDPKRQANTLIPGLEGAGVEVTKTTARQMAQACGQLFSAVTDSRSLRHLGQPDLDSALARATKRELEGAWAWDGRTGVDISPLVAVTLAAWGYTTQAHQAYPPADVFF
jgi:hypothetical protein